MSDLLAWLTEHGATLTVMLYVARKVVEIRAENARAGRIAAEAAAKTLADERARCDALERQVTSLASELADVRRSINAAGHVPPTGGA